MAALQAVNPTSPMDDADRQMILTAFEEQYGEGAVEELRRQLEEAQEVPIDNVPAMLTEGEVVIPRDAVKAAGNGDVETGAGELMSMVGELRAMSGGNASRPPNKNNQGLGALG